MMSSHPQRKKRRNGKPQKRTNTKGSIDPTSSMGSGMGSTAEAATTLSSSLKNTGKRAKLTVCVRVRPRLHHEVVADRNSIARVMEDKMVVLMDPHDNSDDVLRKNRSREKHFAFDTCFSPTAEQKEVYTMTTKPLIKGVLNGYNATVFAYGPTGSGKTYTMLGNASSPGIMTHTMRDLFRLVERRRDETDSRITMTYVELYNEYLYDLLVEDSDELEMREDAQGNNHVIGAKEVDITNPDQVLGLLMEGNRRRTQEATAANSTSSRSHAILCIRVRSTPRVQDVHRKYKLGQLFMCDLAGSERAAHTKNVGKRMVEGQHINRSLLALGNCINSLGSHGHVKYVNYRDSKLTRLLKQALGGNCRTVMIAHISPCDHHFEESYNTLTYANRAKNIKTRVLRNAEQVQAHVTEYTHIIASLKDQIASLQARLTDRKKSAPPRPRSASADSKRPASDAGMQNIVDFQMQLDQMLREQLDLFSQLHDVRHKSLEVVLDAREQTSSSLLADNVFDLDMFDEASDSKQVVQLVSDQVALARDKLKQLEETRQAILARIDAGREEAQQLLQQVQEANENDENEEHVLAHLHGLFNSKLALAGAESSRTSLQQYLMETSAALENIQRQSMEQSHVIRQQARLLAEHGIELPASLQLEQRKAIADERVAAAMMSMNRELPLMCLDPEEIIRRRNAQRVQPKRLHDQLRKHYSNRMKTISSLGFTQKPGNLARSQSLTGIHRGSLVPAPDPAQLLSSIELRAEGADSDSSEGGSEHHDDSRTRPVSKVRMRRSTMPSVSRTDVNGHEVHQQLPEHRQQQQKHGPTTSTPLPATSKQKLQALARASGGRSMKRSDSTSTYTVSATPQPLDRTYTRGELRKQRQQSGRRAGSAIDNGPLQEEVEEGKHDKKGENGMRFDHCPSSAGENEKAGVEYDDDDDDDDFHDDTDDDDDEEEESEGVYEYDDEAYVGHGEESGSTSAPGDGNMDSPSTSPQDGASTNKHGTGDSDAFADGANRNQRGQRRHGKDQQRHGKPTPVAPQLDIPPKQLRVESSSHISPRRQNHQGRRSKQPSRVHPSLPALAVHASPYAVAPRHRRRGGR